MKKGLRIDKKIATELTGELSALRDFFACNTFVRKKYLSLISELPKKSLIKDRGASYPSILDIQTHIVDVCRSWLHVYETGEDLPDLKGLSIIQLKKLQKEVDNYMSDFMQKLRAEDLNKSFHNTLGTGRSKRVITRNVGAMLWHMIEEELQHRGELNALLWQDDIEPPVTSWFEWRKVLEK